MLAALYWVHRRGADAKGGDRCDRTGFVPLLFICNVGFSQWVMTLNV